MSIEHLRIALFGALLAVSFLLWSAWDKEHPRAQVEMASATQATTSLPEPASDLPAVSNTNPVMAPLAAKGKIIHVKTDVLDISIDTAGGNIISANLIAYPESIKTPNQPFSLLSDNPSTWYVAQSGLVGKDGPDSTEKPAIYTASQNSYTLSPGQNELVVPLSWKNAQGLSVEKLIKFQRGSYLINVEYKVDNQSSRPWSGYFYAQLQRKNIHQDSGGFFKINPYVGAAFSSPDDRYQKVSFDKMKDKDFNQTTQDGWAAILQHYFLAAWIPDSKQTHHYVTNVEANDVYDVRMMSSPISVAPAASYNTSAKLYVGPAIGDVLKNIAPGLDLTVDYGMLWFIAVAIFWVMKQINSVVHNWGWSIVLVTVFIKLLFYKLSAASYRSMASMKRLQPKLQALQKRYADDKPKLSQATMELYKTEKVNPFGGCLPVLVQIPFFIALYWVLLESVQLRQAPFILWIHDLSLADPYYVLPIIMGISILVQQKMNPPPPDPVQAKIMLILPVFFTILFLSFPAGLVLYWVVNNVLSILQQWYVMKTVEQHHAVKKLRR